MPRIFISYSRSDRQYVDKYIPVLRRFFGNDSVWFDEEIIGGTNWWAAILSQIKDCDLFLFLMSKSSQRSLYCQAELREAIRLRKAILPIVVHSRLNYPGSMPSDLKEWLSQTQYLDLSRKGSASLTELAVHVKRLSDQIPAKPLPPLSSEPVSCPPAITEDSKARYRGIVLFSALAVLILFFVIIARVLFRELPQDDLITTLTDPVSLIAEKPSATESLLLTTDTLTPTNVARPSSTQTAVPKSPTPSLTSTNSLETEVAIAFYSTYYAAITGTSEQIAQASQTAASVPTRTLTPSITPNITASWTAIWGNLEKSATATVWTATPGSVDTGVMQPQTGQEMDSPIYLVSSTETAEPGEALTWGIHLVNRSTSVIDEITITFALPELLTLDGVFLTGQGEVSIEGSVTTITSYGLGPNSEYVVLANTTVEASAPSPSTVTLTACALVDHSPEVCDSASINLGPGVGTLPSTGGGGNDHGDEGTPVPTPGLPSNTELLLGSSEFTAYLAALTADPVLFEEALVASNLVTLFVPSERAFAELMKNQGITLEDLLMGNTALSDVLRYHIIDGAIPFDDLSRIDSAVTLSGERIVFRRSGYQIYLNDSAQIVRNYKTANGYIYVIDSVLSPIDE